MLLTVLLFIGSMFGFLGAVMAYLITYNEYLHHYPDKREPRRIALRTGIFTFIFFVALSTLLAYIFAKINL